MGSYEASNIDELGKELTLMAIEAKQQNMLLASMTDSEVVKLLHQECQRLMEIDMDIQRNNRKLYDQLSGEKENGRLLCVYDISRDILTRLVHDEEVTIKDIAELFNTTKKNVSDMKREYCLTDTERIIAEYRKHFKLACENAKNNIKVGQAKIYN